MNQPSLFDTVPRETRAKPYQIDELKSVGTQVATPTEIEAHARLPGDSPPRARATDPTSSHRAADRVERSGKLRAQAGFVLLLVERFPGRTSAELAQLAQPPGISAEAWRFVVARRLPDPLGRRGLVVRTQLGDDDMRWWTHDCERPAGCGDVVPFPPRRPRRAA